MKKDELEKFKKLAAEIERKQADPRFVRVMGTFVAVKALIAPNIQPLMQKLSFDDVLWAAKVEPRIFEVLPALVIRRPRLFRSIENMPKDLHGLIGQVRANRATQSFRGVPPEKYMFWVKHFGRMPSGDLTIQKNFRFTSTDAEVLNSLTKKLKLSATDVIRKALVGLQGQVLSL